MVDDFAVGVEAEDVDTRGFLASSVQVTHVYKGQIAIDGDLAFEVELSDRARPCFGVPALTGLEGCLTDVPRGKRRLLDGLEGTENPRVGGSIPPLGTNLAESGQFQA